MAGLRICVLGAGAMGGLRGAIIKMARLVGEATPTCEIIFSLVRQRARIAGGAPAAAPAS
jgi:ketopantoate reductase